METAKKITLFVPERLLTMALSVTGKGITTTIRQGLELIAAGKAYSGLRKAKGKVSFSISLNQMKEDRS